MHVHVHEKKKKVIYHQKYLNKCLYKTLKPSFSLTISIKSGSLSFWSILGCRLVKPSIFKFCFWLFKLSLCDKLKSWSETSNWYKHWTNCCK